MHEQEQAVCSRRPAVAFSLAVLIHSAASKDAKFFSAVARMIDTVLVYNMRYLDSAKTACTSSCPRAGRRPICIS